MLGVNDRPLFLLDSAIFSLAPGINWDGEALRDLETGATYPVNPTGRFILDRQDGTVSVADLARELERSFGIGPSTARTDLYGFLLDLHSLHLVSIRQPYPLELLARIRNLLWGSVRFSYPNRRYPVTTWNVLAGGLEAHQTTVAYGIAGAIAAGVLVALPGALRGNPPPLSLSITAALLVLFYVVALIASGWLHELVHCWAAGRLGQRLTSVFVRMHVFGVTHQSNDVIKSAYVSAAGPAVTTLVLSVVAFALWNATILPESARLEFAVLLLAVAVQHVPGLTPLTRDGRFAFRAVALLARSRVPGR